MATSQNGWSVYTSSSVLKTLPWITGRVRPGDVAVVFDWLGARFNAQVEKITPVWSWGWAYRPIAGQTSGYSNHASGTAVDLNAPAHPLGKAGTFSAKQVLAIHKILDDTKIGGVKVIRWGGDYTGRKDEMHFEINAGSAKLHDLATKVARQPAPPAWKPNPANPIDLSNVQIQFRRALHVAKGPVVRLNGIGLIQAALNSTQHAGLAVDGYVGTKTLSAWAVWEARHHGKNRPRVPDTLSLPPLAKAAGYSWRP